MSTPAADGDGFHVVVAEDGSVPASELARLGLSPGTHLRLVPQQDEDEPPRRSARGALAYLVSANDVDAFEKAMEDVRTERAALLDR